MSDRLPKIEKIADAVVSLAEGGKRLSERMDAMTKRRADAGDSFYDKKKALLPVGKDTMDAERKKRKIAQLMYEYKNMGGAAAMKAEDVQFLRDNKKIK